MCVHFTLKPLGRDSLTRAECVCERVQVSVNVSVNVDEYIPLNPVSGPEVAVTGGDAGNGPRQKRAEKGENEKVEGKNKQ